MVLFTAAKVWAQRNCHGRTDGENRVYTQRNIIQPSKRKILPFVVPWMTPEDVMLRAIGQTQEDKYGLIPAP